MTITRGTLYLLVGPSRVGKDSILRGLLKLKALRLRKLVTCTTRPRRPHEVAGQTYHYLSEDEFMRQLAKKQFLEWAPVRHHRFGTPSQPLLTWLKAGYDVLQQIDIRGADALRRVKGIRVVTIFILPGSVEELRRRMRAAAFTPEQRRIRWQETRRELKKQTAYDFRVVNAEGQLHRAIREVAEIIFATSLRRHRVPSSTQRS